MTRNGIRFETGRVASGGEDIYYEVFGEGAETVVLCHGLGGNHAIWFQQIPVLAQRYRVVTWDQRGFGRSSNRHGRSGPDVAVDDLRAILDRVGAERPHLIGQSMGGWAVAGFALGSPDRVRSLVLSDTTGGLGGDEVLRLVTTAERRHVPTDVVGVHRALGPHVPVERGFLYQQLGGFRAEVSDMDIVGKLFSTAVAAEQMRTLSMPVLVLYGVDDDLMPPHALRRVAELLPDARIAEIANAGHSPYFEQPEAWNEAVLDFLASTTQR